MIVRAQRAGMTLVECMIALVLASLVSAAVISVLATQNRLLRSLGDGSADADALRLTAGVLREEMRWIDPARDIRSIGGDSIALRVFRGGGHVCAVTADLVTVAYTGARLPSVDKDSVLLRTAAGEAVRAVRDVVHAPCGTHPGLRLRLDSVAPNPAAYALVFESGSYFLQNRALRYRLGAEGRQPLTDERFATAGYPLRLAHDTSAAIIPIRWPAPRVPDTLMLRFLNARP